MPNGTFELNTDENNYIYEFIYLLFFFFKNSILDYIGLLIWKNNRFRLDGVIKPLIRDPLNHTVN